MAAANLHQLGQGLAQACGGVAPSPLYKCLNAARGGRAHALPYRTFLRLGAAGGMGFDVGQQSRSGGVFTRAAQAQQVLQVEEGQHLVLPTRGQVVGASPRAWLKAEAPEMVDGP